MRKTRIGRLAAIAALSTALHAGLIASVAFLAPRLAPPSGPMTAPRIVPVIMTPRVPAPPAKARPMTRPSPRRPRSAAVPAPIPPLVIDPPPRTAAPAAESTTPTPGALARALGSRGLGCLNRERRADDPRERCLEQVGAQSREAPPLPPGVALSRRKRAELDALAAQRDAERKALERPLGPGVAKYEAPDYSGEPYTTGVGARDPYGTPPPASRRAARKLQRLPP